MFLNPFMLFGISAVSIPIVIHLLNKRKFKRVTWAAMRFVMEAVKRNQRRLQLEDLLLLALRCLIVLLIAFALARPALQAAGAAGLFGGGKATAVILLDNSYSMSASDGAQSRFEQARLSAREVIDALPTGSSVALLLASDVADARIPEPTFDLHLARRTIDETHLSDRSTNLLPALRAGLDLLGRHSGRRELYLITDGQRLGWRQLDEARGLLEQSRREIRSQLIFVGGPVEQNVGISDLRLASGLAPADQSLRFEVRATNHGSSDATHIRVMLRVNGQDPSDEAIIDHIPPGESRSVSLFAKLRSDAPTPYHAITAQFGAPDSLPADDRRTIVVRALREVNVLLVDGDTGRETREAETFYLRHALQPVAPAEMDQYFIRTHAILPAELSRQRLEAYDAVILANVPDFGDAALKSLADYLRRGGRGVIFFPGSNTIVRSYNDQLYGAYGFLPATLGEAAGDEKQSETFITLSPDHLQHPIASLWTDPAAGSVASAHFYRWFPLQLQPKGPAGVAEAGPARTVFSFADAARSPAIVERDWGMGKVVLFASTADTAWNDLPVRPGLFVPLMYRILGSIVARQDEHLNVPVGQPFMYRADVDLLRREALIRLPEPEHEIPASRTVELADLIPMLRFDETSLAGAYEVNIGEGALQMRFAVQSDPAESSLVQLTDEDYRQLGEVASVVRWNDPKTFSGELSEARTGTELWLPLAFAALLLAATESFLAQWFSRSR